MLSAVEFENASSRNRAEPVEIWKTRKFIEEHSGEELSLLRVAKAVHIHPNYLSERFKQVTGMNFVEYVARTRFEKTCKLLHDGGLRISDIRSPRDFNRCRSSIACSKNSVGNRQRNSVLPSVWVVGVSRIPIGHEEKT
jgi:methylphosphotriester-DNA--protein-cysteine methyltransferase